MSHLAWLANNLPTIRLMALLGVLAKDTSLGQGDCPPQEERKSQLLGQSTIYVGLRIEFHSRLEVVADAEGQNVGAVVSFNSSGFLRGA